jgi:hypothetical protein
MQPDHGLVKVGHDAPPGKRSERRGRSLDGHPMTPPHSILGDLGGPHDPHHRSARGKEHQVKRQAARWRIVVGQ